MSNDSLSTFKEKLTTGGYANLVGARRGIGKFQGMSDSDRDKARAMADKFFWEEGTPAPVAKKTEKKSAPKAPAKRASKKEAVKEATAAKTKKAPVAESKGKGASKASPKAPAAAKAAATKKPVVRAVKTTDVAEGIRSANEKQRVLSDLVATSERMKGQLPDKTFAEIVSGVGECLVAVKNDLMRVCGVPESATTEGMPAPASVAMPALVSPPQGGLFANGAPPTGVR